MMRHAAREILNSVFIASGFVGGFAAGYLAVCFVKEEVTRRRLIKWSDDGKHFLGPLCHPDYQRMSNHFHKSPDSETTIGIDSVRGRVYILQGDTQTYSLKCLHADGNTRIYKEAMFGRETYFREWDENGNETTPGSN
jgi:hypothetical protein